MANRGEEKSMTTPSVSQAAAAAELASPAAAKVSEAAKCCAGEHWKTVEQLCITCPHQPAKTDPKRELLEGLLDIWDEGRKPEEFNAYTPNAMAEAFEDVRAYLYGQPSETAAPATQVSAPPAAPAGAAPREQSSVHPAADDRTVPTAAPLQSPCALDRSELPVRPLTDADARDAARYRWLRDPENDVAGWGPFYAGEGLDEAVDAAMDASPVSQQAEGQQ
jgi:hypothetical protein